jgi:YVTN family beta-propeller protein
VIDPALMDGTSRAIVATVTVGPNPFGIAVTPDSKHVYVSNSGGNTVSVIDAATVSSGASTPTITVGNSPRGVSVSSDGSTVFVVNWFSGNLTAISVATNATRTIAPAGILFPVAFGNFVTPITFITVNFEVVPKAVYLKSQGTIPVIIYGSKSFDVHTLDLSSLRLNGMAVKIKPSGEPMTNYGDYAGSGYDDVMVHFSADGVQATSGDATVTLTGQTMCSPLPCTGTPIQGTATVTFLH